MEKPTATVFYAEKLDHDRLSQGFKSVGQSKAIHNRMDRPCKHGQWAKEVVSLMTPHLLTNEPDITQSPVLFLLNKKYWRSRKALTNWMHHPSDAR